MLDLGAGDWVSTTAPGCRKCGTGRKQTPGRALPLIRLRVPPNKTGADTAWRSRQASPSTTVVTVTAALLVVIGEQRDELHRFAAVVAEDLATPNRYLKVADRLCRLGQQLGSHAHRIAIDQGAPEL